MLRAASTTASSSSRPFIDLTLHAATRDSEEASDDIDQNHHHDDEDPVLVTYPWPVAEDLCDIVRLTQQDITRLNDSRSEFNDSLINFYITYLKRSTASPIADRCYFFNTYFYSALQQNDSSNRVGSWTKDVDLFEKDFLIVPINDPENHHWTVCIVRLTTSLTKLVNNAANTLARDIDGVCIIYLDSFRAGHSYAGGGDGDTIIPLVRVQNCLSTYGTVVVIR